MATITFTIDNGKLDRVKDALKGLYPIPTTQGPDDPVAMPMFTDNQWAKECVRRWIVKQVARWEKLQAINAVQYNEEDDLVQ